MAEYDASSTMGVLTLHPAAPTVDIWQDLTRNISCINGFLNALASHPHLHDSLECAGLNDTAYGMSVLCSQASDMAHQLMIRTTESKVAA